MAEPLRDKQIVKTPPVQVSPYSTLPPGLDEGEYVGNGMGGEDFDELSEYNPADEDVDAEPGDETTGTPPSSPHGLPPAYVPLDAPQNVHVKSQTVKVSPDGTTMVDVVLAWDAVEGAEDYEVNVIKWS